MPPQGTYGFTGVQTRVPTTRVSAWRTFFWGVHSYTEPERDVTQQLRFGRTEFYLQDTWKIRPNFQLDYGIRYYRFRQPMIRTCARDIFAGILQPGPHASLRQCHLQYFCY